MLERIRYKLLMRRLRVEIASVVNGSAPSVQRQPREKIKTPAAAACKACGSIV